jgi:hypothetical protein
MTTGDLQASEYEFFRGTFDYLKRNNANVNISAGRTEYVGLHLLSPPPLSSTSWLTPGPRACSPSNVVKAIHEGGACRVSGAYQVHRSPDLMNYCGAFLLPPPLATTHTHPTL